MPVAARDVLIGVHVTTASQELAATLAAIHGATAPPFRLVVLADPAPGEAATLAGLLAGLSGIPVLSPGQSGAAACFNRLLACPADTRVFLECGARPGPGWLAHLQAALDADPAHGLAGPSTDHCWNEQGVAPGCGAADADVRRAAEEVLRRFGRACRPMTPLHNLADFCLAVRADVVAAVGAADEAYGRGPCWEMDYAVRAARAGFRSVWAQAAFVRRGSMPAWRVTAEPALIEVSKRLYQDRFCGRRRTPAGVGAPYHESCRGEACRDFAPAGAIEVRLPLPTLETPPTDEPPAPLISCVMPTRGRARFVAQSVAYFRRQTYPNRELVIVHEDDADLPPDIEGPDVRLVRTRQHSVGAKRTAGARAARGEIIVHWDDDDWYGAERLARQAAPILQGAADITGLGDMLFMVLQSGEFWSATPELFARLFLEGVSGGTLMFRRSVWERSGPYPAISLREDAEFMVQAMRGGARLCRLPGRDLCIYVRHDANTWKFSEGRYLQPDQWSRVAAPAFVQPDLAFYGKGAAPRPPRPSASRVAGPLVTCVMPTANRRAFVPQAIRSFLAQDYADRELVVIDDGRESVADLIPPAESIRYVRLDRRLTIGAKRNAAAELARGEIIAHWDDDDWMAPQWLGSQVRTLLDDAADVCGLDKVYFYAPETRQGWRYVYDGVQPWVCGGTLCYTQELWRRSPFPEIDVGEDNQFVWSPAPKSLAINRRHDLYVATVHRGNTSPKLTTSRRWRSVPAGRLEQLMRGVPEPEGAA